MNVQKAIFPGLILGIFCLIGITSFLAATHGTGIVTTGAGSFAAENTNSSNECSISDSYPESVRQWCSEIERYARENEINPNLVSAVMLQESAGRPDAYSKSGAVGLLQVMPRDGKAADFMCPNGPCFASRPSMEELFDPEFNISYGTKMLSQLIDKYGDLRTALKAYGPKDVGYYYADIVLNIMNNHQ